MNSTDLRSQRKNLKTALDSLGKWMTGLTALVVLGLIFEYKSPFFDFLDTCTGWNLFTCNWSTFDKSIGALMVTIGVAGELLIEFFANRREHTLQEITDVIESDLQQKLKQADVRIAEAELETEKLKKHFSWRTLGQDQIDVLINSLKSAPGNVSISYVSSDAEAKYFASQLMGIFQVSNWTFKITGGTNGGMGGPQFGIIIQTPTPALQGLTLQITSAFTKANIPFTMGNVPGWNVAYINGMQLTAPPVEIYVGPKPPLI